MADSFLDRLGAIPGAFAAMVNPYEWWDEEGNFIGPVEASVQAQEDYWQRRDQETAAQGGTPGQRARMTAEEKARAIEAAKERIQQKTQEFQEVFGPFVRGGQEAVPVQSGFQTGGAQAWQAQQALAGLLGPEAQQAAIAQLESSPQFQALAAQGEQAILANAAATGGVRGGNTQAALAQFRPGLLAQAINEQYGRLMGMSGLGAQTGQGLITAGLQGAGGFAETGMRGEQLAADLATGAADTRAAGQLAEIQYELDQQAKWDEILAAIASAAGSVGGAMLAGPGGAVAGGAGGGALARMSNTPGV